MEPNVVYVKTSAGEEAMRQRTRLVQRNMRMILILVDGKTSFAGLCGKTGNPQLTENTLLELEKGGFIQTAPKIDQDPIWAEGKSVAKAIREAVGRSDDEVLFAQRSRTSEIPAYGQREKDSMQASDMSITMLSVSHFERGIRNASLGGGGAPLSLAPQSRPAPIPDEPPQASESSGVGLKIRGALKTLAGLFQRGKADKPCARPQTRIPGFSHETAKRGSRLRAFFSILIGVIVLAPVVAVLYPYNNHLAAFEASISRLTGLPVNVSQIQVAFFPTPRLILKEVKVGAGAKEMAGKHGLQVDQVRLLPNISSSFGRGELVSDVVVQGIELGPEQTGTFASIVASVSASPVGKMGIEDVSIAYGGVKISGMAGEVRLTSSKQLDSLLLSTADKDLSLRLKQEGRTIDFTMEGVGWKVPDGSRHRFDSVSVHGRVVEGVLNVDAMDLRIFGGRVQGGLAIVSPNRQVPADISGALSFERINLSTFGPAIGLGQQFSGELTGKIRFSAATGSWEKILRTLNTEGDIAVRRGVISGIDLAEAARRVAGTPVQGGATAFEELTGKVRVSSRGYQLTGLVIDSGRMRSTGHLAVDNDLNVNGHLELQIMGTASRMQVPINIGGNLRSPIVQAGHRSS
ncbi:AsmA-like C-terminal region-containing protein [Propionivibrio limicola]|uniref:AsmA-like C-terminal region-containing protein n=1 Tax=Propionivibrio limicola TaxID=167645 RepID=UPI001290F2AC|nr:AsmA-like C-terminal region-containing protein [Propionivibrio limicola]